MFCFDCKNIPRYCHVLDEQQGKSFLSFPIAGITNKEKHFPLQEKFWIYKAAYNWYNTLTLVRADDPQERRQFGLQQDKDPAACGIIQSRMKDKTRMQMSWLSLDKNYGNQAE